jgi:hypothetical protein
VQDRPLEEVIAEMFTQPNAPSAQRQVATASAS